MSTTPGCTAWQSAAPQRAHMSSGVLPPKPSWSVYMKPRPSEKSRLRPPAATPRLAVRE